MKKRSGFTLLEVLIALMFVVMMVVTFFPILSWLISRTKASENGTEAGIILQNGMETAYNVMLTGWDTDWVRFPAGIYHPAIDATSSIPVWTLLPGNETGVEAIFNRQVEIEPVCRNRATGERLPGNCAIHSANVDNNSKILRTIISWTEQGRNKSLSAELLVTYLGK